MSEMMGILNDEPSEVQTFYDGCCIFITGGSGFLGHLLIQKLIRHCSNLSKIYILMRDKKGVSSNERFKRMFEDPVFERMKMEHPDYIEKIKLVAGDLQQPYLGINEKDKTLLFEEVNIIFHVGATVKFDEKIKLAAIINTKATIDIIALARNMNNLKAFVYCSTAYSNYPRKTVDEVIYNMHYTPEKILKMIDILTDDELEVLTKKLLRGWANTYVFTKCLAENFIKEQGKDLPTAIVRPSIVTPTVSDPLEGWVKGIAGPVGLYCGGNLGVLRVVKIIDDKIADYMPGDYVINNMIVAAYYVGTKFNKNINGKKAVSRRRIKSTDGITVFNCTSGAENPFTWADFRHSIPKMANWPSSQALWYVVLLYETRPYILAVKQLFLNLLPAYLFDFILHIKGGEKKIVKAVEKLHRATDVLSNFTCHEWNFINDNTQVLWNRLNATDRKLFNFSIKSVNWMHYFAETFPKGIYVYIMKDSVEKIDQVRARYKKLRYLNEFLIYLLYIICSFIVFKILRMFI